MVFLCDGTLCSTNESLCPPNARIKGVGLHTWSKLKTTMSLSCFLIKFLIANQLECGHLPDSLEK